MKNEMLIKNLSADLKPWKQMDSLPVFGFKWLIISVAFFGINALWMPWRVDFPSMTDAWNFHLENILWLTLTVSSAVALYKSSFPQNQTKNYSYFTSVILLMLFALAFYDSDPSFSHQWLPEMSWWRGRCGIIISLFAIIEAPVLAAFTKKGAPRNSGMSGVYAALSSASLGCLLMQFICDHHNSLHLMIWHFLPLMLMSLAGYGIAKKLLRW